MTAKVARRRGKNFMWKTSSMTAKEVGDEQAKAYSKISLYGEVLSLGHGLAVIVFVAERCASHCSR